jgi:DNA-directed RNA polymerase specialized sigma24 family protein
LKAVQTTEGVPMSNETLLIKSGAINSEGELKSGLSINSSSHIARKTFQEIIVKHGKYIKTFISTKVCNKDDVDYLYQITLLDAFKSFSGFREEYHPRVWICGIAYTAVEKFLKNKRNQIAESFYNLSALVGFQQENEWGANLISETSEALYERIEFLSALRESFEGLVFSVE